VRYTPMLFIDKLQVNPEGSVAVVRIEAGCHLQPLNMSRGHCEDRNGTKNTAEFEVRVEAHVVQATRTRVLGNAKRQQVVAALGLVRHVKFERSETCFSGLSLTGGSDRADSERLSPIRRLNDRPNGSHDQERIAPVRFLAEFL